MALLYASAVNKRINSPGSAQSSPAQSPRKTSTASSSGRQQRRHRTPTEKTGASVYAEEQHVRRKCSTPVQLEAAGAARMSNSNRSSEESLTGKDSEKVKRTPKPVSKRSMTATLANEHHKEPTTSRKISAPHPPRSRTGSESGRDKPPDLRRILAMKRLIEYSIEASSSSSNNSPSPDRELIAALSSPRKKISVVDMRPMRPPLVRKRSLSVDTGAMKATLDEAIAAQSRKKDPIQGALSKIRNKFNKWKLRRPDRSPSYSDTDEDDDGSSDGTVV
uniref:Uncharacterized protein n=1 Tax=Plectus sambesii TaxID=2011161 RepID=A0A914WU33_9BILA